MTEQKQDEYFELAQSWALESDARQNKSRRIAWTVAGVAAGVAALEALALVMLVPLKETESVMLLVDRTTGYVQEISPSQANGIRADDALLESMLAQYVAARERFDRDTVQEDYRKASLWSDGTVGRAYAASMAATTPRSPFTLYRSREVREVEVKSVTQVERGRALVRFDSFLTTGDGRRVPDGSWISLVRYRFSDAPMAYEDRLLNPLGLQVTGYRRDAERPAEAVPLARPLDVAGDGL